jgi:hypothetical protein
VTRVVSVAERRARLARRHRLLPEERTDDLAAVADGVVALHSSDPVTVHLSAAVRMRHPDVAPVEQALYEDRTLVRHHGMRRTLWVATPEVIRLVHAAATRKLVGPERRRTAKLLADNGIEDPDSWLDDARDQAIAVLHTHGPMTARALGEQVPALRHKIVMAPGKSYSATVSAHTRVLLALGFEGEVLRTRPAGTWINGAYTYTAADTWLDGGLGELDEREAARDLALRWLRAFGPATSRDLQWWTGWTSATTKRALSDLGAVEVRVDSGAAYVVPGDEGEEPPAGPWAALLPGLDPTTMGWKERDWYLPPQAGAAFDRMGNAGPTIWVDGRVVGVWVQDKAGELRTHLFERLTPQQQGAVDERLRTLSSVIGATRFTVRFPSPVSTALATGAQP